MIVSVDCRAIAFGGLQVREMVDFVELWMLELNCGVLACMFSCLWVRVFVVVLVILWVGCCGFRWFVLFFCFLVCWLAGFCLCCGLL